MELQHVTVDETLLIKLRDAQLAYVVELIQSEHYKTSDDGFDELSSALSLADELLRAQYDDDTARVEHMLNTLPGAHDSIAQYACDGVCAAIHELNPPALQMD